MKLLSPPIQNSTIALKSHSLVLATIVLCILSQIGNAQSTPVDNQQTDSKTASWKAQPILSPGFPPEVIHEAKVQQGISNQPLIFVPSPLSQWQSQDSQQSVTNLLSQHDEMKSIVVEVRALSFANGEKMLISEHFKPGTFEVISGSVPSTLPVATNESEPPVHSTKVSNHQSETKLATSIRSTEVSNPVALAKIGQDGLRNLIQKTKGRSGVNLTQMPTMMSYSGQTGSISDAASRPFVVGVKPQVDGNDAKMQPVIQMVEDGITMRLKSNIKESKIEIMADMALSQVTAVKTYSFPQFRDEDLDSGVTIQMPEVTRDSLHIATTLEDGETLFIDSMMTRREKMRVPATKLSKPKIEEVEMRIFFLVTARIVDHKTENASMKKVSLNQ